MVVRAAWNSSVDGGAAAAGGVEIDGQTRGVPSVVTEFREAFLPLSAARGVVRRCVWCGCWRTCALYGRPCRKGAPKTRNRSILFFCISLRPFVRIPVLASPLPAWHCRMDRQNRSYGRDVLPEQRHQEHHVGPSCRPRRLVVYPFSQSTGFCRFSFVLRVCVRASSPLSSLRAWQRKGLLCLTRSWTKSDVNVPHVVAKIRSVHRCRTGRRHLFLWLVFC